MAGVYTHLDIVFKHILATGGFAGLGRARLVAFSQMPD